MAIADPAKLLTTLCSQPRETEWLEFKQNKFSPEETAEYVCALANSAMLKNEPHAYLVFGVEDESHDVVGTRVRLKREKVGAEPFENWLSRALDPRITVTFVELEFEGKHVEIIIIDPAYQRPVRFKTEAFIRIDSVQKKLRDFPERERALWAVTSRFAFERGIAVDHLYPEEILDQFDCKTFFALLKLPKLSSDAMIQRLVLDGLIVDDKQGGFDVTNSFALVCARDMTLYSSIAGKSPRVIQYKAKSKIDAVDDVTGRRGYAISFPRMLKYIMNRVPHREEMRAGVRQKIFSYPEIAVREFVANALIHQDLTSTGDRPTIEIFSDKLRITNPGAPLVPPERFIDAPHKSRNEHLAGLMRRLGFCEERGSGVDRALEAIETENLPPPLFQKVEESTVVTLISEREFSQMSKEDRIRACYQHASLRFVSHDPMSNSSLRLRFGLSKRQYPQVSLVIRDSVEAGLIKPLEEDQAKRTARYHPIWA